MNKDSIEVYYHKIHMIIMILLANILHMVLKEFCQCLFSNS